MKQDGYEKGRVPPTVSLATPPSQNKKDEEDPSLADTRPRFPHRFHTLYVFNYLIMFLDLLSVIMFV